MKDQLQINKTPTRMKSETQKFWQLLRKVNFGLQCVELLGM